MITETTTELQTYSQYRPTPNDRAGLGCDDRQAWLVAPVIQTRDSGPTEQSNFAACLKLCGDESETCEVHRFNHWGPGWFEIVLVAPDSAAAQAAIDCKARLEDYPLLDEDDASQREHADYIESWKQCQVYKDFTKAITKEFGLLETTADKLGDIDSDKLLELYESGIPSGDYYEVCDNGANFGRRCEHSAGRITRPQLAAFLKANR